MFSLPNLYLAAVATLTVVTFAAYGFDKWRARRGGRRVSEMRLHLLALAGGFPGAWLGRIVFRHKTRKWIFSALIAAAALIHAALGGAYLAFSITN